MLEGTNLSSKNIDHLGLVAGMCKELGIAEVIDKAIPNPKKGKIVSYGKLVEAMCIKFNNRKSSKFTNINARSQWKCK